MSFPRQFTLAAEPRRVLPGWLHKSVDAWSLWHCPTLTTRSIVDGSGVVVGWLLDEVGLPADSADALQVDDDIAAPTFVSSVERALDGIVGRFLAIVPHAPVARVYTGPGGMPAVVYNERDRTVASSSRWAADGDDLDTDLIQVLDIPRRDRYFPFGLTPDRRVRRLLPNHYLDLATFQPVRRWPAPDVRFGSASQPEAVVDAIASRLQLQADRLADRSRTVSVSLTAGRDSRIVLAAARRLLPRVECHTFGLDDPKAQLDCRVAASIARSAGLTHRVVPWLEPGRTELEEWQEWTGHCVAGRVWHAVATQKQMDGTQRLTGMCGEVGRGFYWRAGDLDGGSLSADRVVAKMGLPPHPRLWAEAERWLASLPVRDVPDVLDLLYVEQRLGCWAAPVAYGERNTPVAPLCDHRTFELMLSLPHEYRFAQGLAPDLIARLWPDLLKHAFNEEIGLRRVVGTVKRRARRALSALQMSASRTGH